jgi:gamma-glutamyltranspeptidase/glutathione hydrolase
MRRDRAIRFALRRGLLPCLLFSLSFLLPAPAVRAAARGDVVGARNGLVVSVSPPASEAGLAVLKQGGNAVDSAVATAFALAVTHPAAGNIGGGGYLLVYPGGKQGQPLVIDFRETAPAAATRDMFVKPAGRTPHRRVGVPGTVRGLALAHKKFGKRPWKELLAPAVRLARDGFRLDAVTAASLNRLVKKSAGDAHAELRRVFGKKSGTWKAGDTLVQPDLASALALIADKGPDTFYTGKLAGLFVAEIKRGGGLITRADLEAYRAVARPPVHGTYRGYDVYGAPPSSSGGTCLVEMLNILEQFDLRKRGRWAPETLHLLAEAMRRAYCDRARHLGDPDFVKVPAYLLTKEYAKKLAKGIDLKKATPSADLAKDIPLAGEGEHTTHLSVIDRRQMAVSLTYTLESLYGSRVVVRGAGFLLNDEMNDFVWRPGVTDRRGRIGTKPNQIAPGKRMLSSQTPTVIARNGRPVLITGSPGGRTIINTVLCVVVNVLDFGMDIRSAVDAPRMHHQWFPDRVGIEPGLAKDHADALRKLRAMGHAVGRPARQGDAHSIWVDPRTGRFVGAADRRILGKAAGY